MAAILISDIFFPWTGIPVAAKFDDTRQAILIGVRGSDWTRGNHVECLICPRTHVSIRTPLLAARSNAFLSSVSWRHTESVKHMPRACC
jgi:hypothetical protein